VKGFGFDINSLIYLLTGIGKADDSTKSASSFMATSTKYMLNMPKDLINFYRVPRVAWHVGTGPNRMVSFIESMEQLQGDVCEFVPYLW
jgi:hypothetical protein